METTINNQKALDDYIVFLRAKLEKDKAIKVSAKSAKARTLTQNRTLHLFCTHLAKALNDGGFDFRAFIKEGYPVPFNEALVKEYIWGPIQKAITGFDSSTKPTPKQYSEIYDALNTKLIEHGLFCPWPCKEEMIAKSYHE
ncbi:hypothetical protein OAP25_02030 [Flavobacteriaceae bacterium]|nr:hypothetical protein [Flavobacteriaceae bacterium]